MKSREVSPAELERRAFESGQQIILPVGAGWARLTVAGERFHAWSPAPGQAVAL